MSDNRSGSTLLDQLLGANPSIMSLGEVHHLAAYALQDRSIYDPVHPLVCSCGYAVPNCTFWSGVEDRLGQPLSSLRMKLRLFDRRRHKYAAKRFTKRTVRNVLDRYPKLLSTILFRAILSSKQLARDSFDLFDAAFDASGVRYLVDSSKSTNRMRTLYDHKPERLIVIMLARNYKGTVHSKMKRGVSMEQAIESWTRQIVAMKKVVDDIPKKQVIRVKYEDLCANPAEELNRICGMLDVDFSEEMLSRPSDGVHHLGGSPSKFDPNQTDIAFDDSYLTAFSVEQLEFMKTVVGDAARDWGYD
jgi:hypothetical protein